jgi:hypothetical protein
MEARITAMLTSFLIGSASVLLSESQTKVRG